MAVKYTESCYSYFRRMMLKWGPCVQNPLWVPPYSEKYSSTKPLTYPVAEINDVLCSSSARHTTLGCVFGSECALQDVYVSSLQPLSWNWFATLFNCSKSYLHHQLALATELTVQLLLIFCFSWIIIEDVEICEWFPLFKRTNVFLMANLWLFRTFSHWSAENGFFHIVINEYCRRQHYYSF